MAAVPQPLGYELTDLPEELPTLPTPAEVLGAETALAGPTALATIGVIDVPTAPVASAFAYEATPALRAFAVDYRTFVAAVAPCTAEARGFIGQLAALRALPEIEEGQGAGVQVLRTSEHEGITVTDFDPGPALQVLLRFGRLSLSGLRLLYGSGLVDDPETLLTRDAYDALCRRGYFAYRSGVAIRVRVGPVRLVNGGLGLMQFYRLQPNGAPEVEFDSEGRLLSLTVHARAVQSPMDALRADATLGLCGEIVRLPPMRPVLVPTVDVRCVRRQTASKR